MLDMYPDISGTMMVLLRRSGVSPAVKHGDLLTWRDIVDKSNTAFYVYHTFKYNDKCGGNECG